MREVGAPSKQNLQLSLGGTSNLWDIFLQSVLPKLANRFPNLYIRTEINQPQYLIRSLLDGRVDIIAVFDPPTNIDIDSRKIGQIELIMVSNKPGQSLDNIPSIGHIFVDWGTAFNMHQTRLFAESVAPVLHTGQSHIALEFLLRHGGAAFLPKALVAPHLNEGLLHQVGNTVKTRQDVHLVYSKGADKTVQLGPIISMLEELDIRPDDPLPII